MLAVTARIGIISLKNKRKDTWLNKFQIPKILPPPYKYKERKLSLLNNPVKSWKFYYWKSSQVGWSATCSTIFTAIIKYRVFLVMPLLPMEVGALVFIFVWYEPKKV